LQRERERETNLPRQQELQELRSQLTNEQQAHKKLKSDLAQIKQDLKLARKKINGYETHLKKELEIPDIKD